MTKLISGRIAKVDSANVSADRYQFIELSETEPDLGLPSQSGQIFTSDLSGNRYWVRLDTANVNETSNLYFTNTRVIDALVGANVSLNNLIITGDLDVQGNLVTLNVVSVSIEDKNLLLANGAVNSSQADGAGITIAGANAEIKYVNVGDLFDINKNVNVQGNISLTGSILSDNDLYVNVDTKSWKFDTGGDLTVPNYVRFEGGTLIGDEPGGAPPNFRIVAPLGYGATIETDSDISGNNFIWTFGQDGITSIPGNVNAQGNVVIDGTFIGNGLIIRNIAVTDDILTGNILGQGFTSNTIVVSETLSANVITGNTAVINNLTVSGDLEVQGNLVTLNTATLTIEDKNILLANGATNSAQADGAGFTIAGANAVLSYSNSGDKFVSNKNLEIQGNLSVGGVGLSNVSGINQLFAGTATANIVTANIWQGLYTANVIESDSNLYYTNTRVFSFVNKLSIGDLADVANIYTYTSANTPNNIVGIQEGQALVWDGNVFIPVFVNSEVANVADLAVRVLSLEGQTTANVAEAASNLYFTNTRVIDAISLATISPNEIYASNVITNTITANIWNNIYTANVIETSGNLYFTNTRAVDAITNANILPYDVTAANDVISHRVITNSILANVSEIGRITVDQLTVNTNLTVYGDVTTYGANDLVISDHLIYINHGSNSAANPDLGIVWAFNPDGDEPYQHGGLFRDASDGIIKFFQHYTIEPDANIFLDINPENSGFQFANVQAEFFIGNVTGTVSSLANHTTDSLAEGTSNLYYTNARVVSAVIPLLTTANVIESDSNLYYTNARVVSAVIPLLTTANVIETDSNLYYTNARVLSNVEQMSINVLADVDITGIGVNAALVWDGTKFVPGSTETALRANFANTSGSANIAGLANVATFANVAELSNVALAANVANLVLTISNFTTSNLTEGSNLYFTNTRVLDALVNANVFVESLTAAGNLVANGLIIRGINVTDSVLTGNITITNITSANVINANLVSSQQWQGIYTANVIETSGNLYFTNTRARTAFLPGKGIAISGDGVITNTGAPFEYNTGIDGSGYANVLSTMSNVVQFSGTSSRDRFLLRSLHITNVSDQDAAISGNVLYATGNTAFFANLLPVPVGSAVELMLNTQLFQPNDIVSLQGFTSSGVATSNILQVVYTSETFSQDSTYQGTGQTLTASNTDILVYDSSTSFSIIESIKVVNLIDSIVPVKIYWADANNVIKAHLAFNTPIPPNSSLETISTPKRILSGDRIFARYANAPNNAVSIFLSARLGYNYSVSGIVSNVAPTGTVSASFTSSEPDGTLLYYTIE